MNKLLFPQSASVLKAENKSSGEATLGQLLDTFQWDDIANRGGKFSFAASADKVILRTQRAEIEFGGADFAFSIDFSDAEETNIRSHELTAISHGDDDGA